MKITKEQLKQIIKEELTNEGFLTTTPKDEDVSAALEDLIQSEGLKNFVHVAVRRLTSNEELEYEMSLALTKAVKPVVEQAVEQAKQAVKPAVKQAYEDIKRTYGFKA